MKPKDFDAEARTWDENPGRVRLAGQVADAVVAAAAPGPDMDVLDYGCGTGLVALRLAPLVRRVLGADNSPGMLAAFRAKIQASGQGNAAVHLLPSQGPDGLAGPFHLIVSSMTLHHVRDVPGLLARFHELAAPGGLVCLADLNPEGGLFHDQPDGVFHHGFAREALAGMLERAGFSGVSFSSVGEVRKPGADGSVRGFSVFLALGRKSRPAGA